MRNNEWPKVVQEWREPERGDSWGAWIFAFVCGFLGVMLLLGGCAASLNVTGFGLNGALDPGKLAPLFRSEGKAR